MLHKADSVAVLKRAVKAGDELLNGSLSVRAVQNINAGHKIALTEIAEGEPVRKYGQVIGFARGKHGQVRSIQAIVKSKVLPWCQCWRTTDAAVLPAYGYERRSTA